MLMSLRLGCQVVTYGDVNRTIKYSMLTEKCGFDVKLSIKADPESSINPAYLSVKQEADTIPPSIGTPIQDPPARVTSS